MENNKNYEMKRVGLLLLRIIVMLAMLIISAALTISVWRSYGFVFGAIAGGICISICTAVSKTMKKHLSSGIEENILTDILKDKIELKEYSPSKHFDKSELRKIGALDGFTSADGGGFIDGTFKGMHFTRCAVTLTERVTDEIYNTETELYEQRTSDVTVFSGYIIRTEHNSPEYAGVSAFSDELDSAAVVRKGRQLWSDNGITIFSAVGENIPLTLTNGLSAVVSETGNPSAAVMTEKYMYVIVSTKKPELTVNMMRSINANKEKLNEQVNRLTMIAEKMHFLQNEGFAENNK